MKISFITGSMRAGGAERVTAVLANEWSRIGHKVDILNLGDEASSFYALSSGIDFHGLRLNTRKLVTPIKFFKLISIIIKLRKIILQSQPQVIVAISDQIAVLSIIATLGLSLPVVACEHTLPHMTSLGRNSRSFIRVFNWLRKIIYRKASAIVVLSEGSRSFFGRALQSRIFVIPNPIWVDKADQIDLETQLPANFILGMGRLNTTKRFDLLIEAFSRIQDKCPDWSLLIAGEGEEGPNLQRQIMELGLSARVKLVGVTKTPHALMRRAKIFVLSSDFEGFPMVLLEAMACGCAVVATDCPSGPREIISNGKNGLLVPMSDSRLLAQAIEQLAQSTVQRNELSTEAQNVVQKYSLEQIASVWERQILSRFL